MKIALPLLIAFGLAGAAVAQDAGKSVWQGIYTGEQAERGAGVYAQRCDACHGAALNGTGNSAYNRLTGNSAGNVLSGLAGVDTLDGGLGADTMAGGIDNDTYVVDDAGDVVSEGANAGTDTVEAVMDYTLTANVENLTLTGTTDLTGTGNALANVITGKIGRAHV